MDTSQFLSPEDAQKQADAAFSPDQEELLRAQLARARALRNQPDYQYTTGIGAALGGLGQLVRTVHSVKDENDINGKLDALRGTRKQAAVGALTQLGQDYGAMDAAQTPEDKAKARRLIAGHSAQLEAFGNKGLSAMGAALNAGTHKDDAVDAKTLGLSRKRLINLKNGKSVSYDPVTGDVEELDGGVGDAAQKVMNAGDHSTISVGPDGAVTQLVKPPPPKPHGGSGAGGGDGVEKGMWGKFIHDINPSTGRAGEMGQNQKRVNAAMRLEQLFQDPAGGVRNLDQREMAELATGLQNLLSPGGHSAGEVEHLIPQTIAGNGQKLLEWLTNDPTGTNQKAFVEKMSHTVGREKAAALKALQTSQYAVVPGYAPLFKADRARAEGILRGQHLDPSLLDENFVYKEPQSAAGATPTSGGAPTHYLVSPDGKLRIPAGPDGKPLPGAKPEPNPNPPKVASRG